MAPEEVAELAVGDWVMVECQYLEWTPDHSRMVPGRTAYEWFQVAEVAIVPPARWGVKGPRVGLAGGCGGGTWLPDPETLVMRQARRHDGQENVMDLLRLVTGAAERVTDDNSWDAMGTPFHEDMAELTTATERCRRALSIT